MKLAVIIGATRPNRQTPKLATWVTKTASALPNIEVEELDLVDYPLPFFNEVASPRYNPARVVEPEVQKWLSALEAYDAYIFVTPEYTHSIPGVLKNSLDYLTNELVHKPAAIVSHGSVGGARAAMHLKEILSESQAVVFPKAVSLTALLMMGGVVDDEGNLSEELKANPYGPQAALDSLLTELTWYSDALAAARA
jgi:NAD(P)H-dependent FMN reductase